MAGHAALPELKKAQRIREKPRGVIQHHVTETPAQHHAKKRGEGDKIGQFRFGQHAAAGARHPAHDKPSGGKTGDIRQPVPADLQPVGESQRNGIQVIEPSGGENGDFDH